MICILNIISLKFSPNGQRYNEPAIIYVMACVEQQAIIQTQNI